MKKILLFFFAIIFAFFPFCALISRGFAKTSAQNILNAESVMSAKNTLKSSMDELMARALNSIKFTATSAQKFSNVKTKNSFSAKNVMCVQNSADGENASSRQNSINEENVLVAQNLLGATSDDITENSFKLLKVTSTNSVSFIYLFPLNSSYLENIDKIVLEGLKFYLKNSVALLAENFEEKKVEGMSVTSPDYYADYDAVGFMLKFESVEALNAYFGEGESVEPRKSGFFIKKEEYEIAFPFSQKTADSLVSLMKSTILLWGSAFNIDVSAITPLYDHSSYIYSLISPNKSVRSENFYEKDGLYYNTFSRTYDELKENKPIVIYYQTINKPAWYLFALLATLSALTLALLLKRKKRHLSNSAVQKAPLI